MNIPFPRLVPEPPLRSSPFKGFAWGLALGLLFGILGVAGSVGGAPSLTMIGYTLAGGAAGTLVGAGLPLFDRRITAGIVVAVAAISALSLLWLFLGDYAGWDLTLFVGSCVGFIYSVLFWQDPGEASP